MSGITNSNRVDNTGNRDLAAKVVDNILNGRTYGTRLMGMGKRFSDKSADYTIKITDSGLGEFYSGLETLNSSASDNTIVLSYKHTAFAQPIVLPMLESFANTGPNQVIDLDSYKVEEGVAEAIQKLGTAFYGTGSGNQPLGLGAIVDDATDVSTIGGQSRSTYSALNATRTASGGTMTLAKLATLHDAVSSASLENEEPNIHVTTKAVWSLYEELLHPNVRAEYQSVGYSRLPVRASESIRGGADLRGAAGFTSLTYRGMPVIKDDAATAQNWFMLNERYLMWKGRYIVPTKYKGKLSKVNLGDMKTMEGVASYTKPSEYNGWFFQDFQMMPNQAGMIARFHVIGQLCSSQPRRNGRLTGITGV